MSKTVTTSDDGYGWGQSSPDVYIVTPVIYLSSHNSDFFLPFTDLHVFVYIYTIYTI